ncbi:MAG: hypothetical protein FJ148_03895 [Deltaproteobacteria bacterium]|nr:hypothetical protein [Deltaproteobacteria bacterium]
MRCPGRSGTVVLLLPLLVALEAGAASAADHVTSGAQLRLRRTPAGGTMILALRDVNAIPAPGGADDPSLTGMVITLFGRTSQQTSTFSASPGQGRPGWLVRSAPRVSYAYVNPSARPGGGALATAVLRGASGLRVRARTAGLALAEPEGAVAVRVEWGNERVCTIFENDAIRRDDVDFFLGVNAAAPQIADCDDLTLGGGTCGTSTPTCGGTCPGDAVCGGNPTFGCTCVSPSQPCGDTAPVCNGECPSGEECSRTGGGPYPACGCLPIASQPCGEQFDACGAGDCPAGTSCYSFRFSVVDYCACASEPPPSPCGRECPERWTCVGPVPGFPAMCVPPFCGGEAPACAVDSCGGGVPNVSCTALGSSTCICVEHCSGGEPFPTCGGTCNGANSICVAVDGKCLCG